MGNARSEARRALAMAVALSAVIAGAVGAMPARADDPVRDPGASTTGTPPGPPDADAPAAPPVAAVEGDVEEQAAEPPRAPEEQEAPAGTRDIVVDKGPTAWSPPSPAEDGWDWIRFDTGEWLKGEIKSLRDDDLEFESDQLDDLSIDWDDVDRLHTSLVRTFVLYDNSTITGTAVMADGVIAVGAGDQTVRFPREMLRKIIPGEERELDYWSMRGVAGLALRSGNTDATEITGSLLVRRDSVSNRFTIDYLGNYDVVDNSKNANNHRGQARLERVITRRFFVYPASFTVFSDEFQNISYRLTPGAGFGYYLVRNKRTEFDVQLGGGYQYTRFDEVQPGESKDAATAVALIGLRFDTDITSDVDFLAKYSLQLGIPDIDETNHHAEATVSLDITRYVDLDVSLIWDRNESPAEDSDGSRPKKDDVRTTVGLAFEF